MEIHAEEVFIQKMEAPEMVADRAIADENGNRIPDTYLTHKAVGASLRIHSMICSLIILLP